MSKWPLGLKDFDRDVFYGFSKISNKDVSKCCTNKMQGTNLPFRVLALNGYRAEKTSAKEFGYVKKYQCYVVQLSCS